jgi:hypothetical protein
MIINSENAIKPYFYLRNSLLHVRYCVDRVVELSEAEEAKIKDEISLEPYNKQKILKDNWNFLTKMVGKSILEDGIAEVNRRIKAKKNGFKN